MTKRDIKFRYKGLYAYISKQYPSNDFTWVVLDYNANVIMKDSKGSKLGSMAKAKAYVKKIIDAYLKNKG